MGKLIDELIGLQEEEIRMATRKCEAETIGANSQTDNKVRLNELNMNLDEVMFERWIDIFRGVIEL